MISDSSFDGIEGIVLDAVGTLIDPAPSVSEAYAAAARRQGVELDLTEVKRRFHASFGRVEGDDRRGPLSTDEDIERRRWRGIVANCLPEIADHDRAFEELWDHFADPASWSLFPDVASTIEALRSAGIRLCVASNFDGRLHRVAAGFAELREWVEPLVISSEVGYRKPHERFYLAACERLDLPPDRILFVGDDIRNDVLGPREVGLRSALIDRGRRAAEAIPGILDDLHLLAAVVLGASPLGK